MKKRLFAVILAVLMVFTLAACSGGSGGKKEEASSAASGSATVVDDTVYELSWAGIGATDAIDTWIGEEAARRIAEKTGDHVKITVHPASQLGDLTQAYDEIIAGTIDMGLFTVYGTYDIINEVNFTCFLTNNLDEFREVYAPGGFIYDTLEKVQADRGSVVLHLVKAGDIIRGVGPDKGGDICDRHAVDLRRRIDAAVGVDFDRAGEEVVGLIVKVLRCINLLNNAVLHNNDTGTKCHSLGLVMCYVDDGCFKSLMKLGDLNTHLNTEFSVQV